MERDMYAANSVDKVAGMVLSKIIVSQVKYIGGLMVSACLIAMIHPLPTKATDLTATIPSPTQVLAEGSSLTKPQAIQAEIERQPRFLYGVREDCTLDCLAKHLKLPVTRLLAYNMESQYVSDIVPAGTKLFIPIRFPLHAEMTVLKVDVLEHRFVAAYGFPVPFSQITEIQEWYEQHLLAYGYEIISGQNNGALHFTGGWVARGTVEFSPGDDTHPTLIDVALVIDENFDTCYH